MFSYTKRVYFCDTDAQGIVYHSRYLDFYEQCRTEYLLSQNITQNDLLKKYKITFVITKITIEYKNAAKLEDLLEIIINEIVKKEPKIFFTQTIKNKTTNKIVSQCSVECITVDDQLKIIRTLPEQLRGIFKV